MNELLWAVIACGIISIVYAVVTIQSVMAADAGNQKMQEIAGAIREGAQAYLNRQYRVVVIVFGVKGQEFSGNLHICIPYLMLEPIKDKLSTKYLRAKDMDHNWSEQLEMLLQDTPVTLIAELGITTRSVEIFWIFKLTMSFSSIRVRKIW